MQGISPLNKYFCYWTVPGSHIHPYTQHTCACVWVFVSFHFLVPFSLPSFLFFMVKHLARTVGNLYSGPPIFCPSQTVPLRNCKDTHTIFYLSESLPPRTLGRIGSRQRGNEQTFLRSHKERDVNLPRPRLPLHILLIPYFLLLVNMPISYYLYQFMVTRFYRSITYKLFPFCFRKKIFQTNLRNLPSPPACFPHHHFYCLA